MDNEITPREVYKAALKGTTLGARIAMHAMAEYLASKGYLGNISVVPRFVGGAIQTYYRFYMWKDHGDEYAAIHSIKQVVKQAVAEAGEGDAEPEHNTWTTRDKHVVVFEVLCPRSRMKAADCVHTVAIGYNAFKSI